MDVRWRGLAPDFREYVTRNLALEAGETDRIRLLLANGRTKMDKVHRRFISVPQPDHS